MSPTRHLTNVVGVDDAPFERDDTGDVAIVGTVYAAGRLDGVLVGSATKDGDDATARLIELIGTSRFESSVNLVMLQGVTLAGFNVVDVHELHRALGLPILVVARRAPDMDAIRQALLRTFPDGLERWTRIERLGPMEPTGPIFVQRVGLEIDEAAWAVERHTTNGHVPEPLRTAHLIAGALARGQSRGRT
jgi:endonuclease V-like protein UPF0215 family